MAKTFTIISAIFGVLAIPVGLITERTTSGSVAPEVSWQAYLTPMHLVIIIGTAAVLGFLYGAIGALVYNIVARWTGGIQVEL